MRRRVMRRRNRSRRGLKSIVTPLRRKSRLSTQFPLIRHSVQNYTNAMRTTDGPE